jgi:hypothetical protein
VSPWTLLPAVKNGTHSEGKMYIKIPEKAIYCQVQQKQLPITAMASVFRSISIVYTPSSAA